MDVRVEKRGRGRDTVKSLIEEDDNYPIVVFTVV